VLEMDPVDDTVWACRKVMPFLGMRRGVLFAQKSRRQTNGFGTAQILSS
jgi:hypothetical protein